MKSIVWFRQDLRMADNPALAHAAARGQVIPVHILDESLPPAGRPLGGASRWWLHKSLGALHQALGHLILVRGEPRRALSQLAKTTGATGVYWNRCYEPYAIARDTDIKDELASAGIDVVSFNASLLHEPWEVRTQDGGPYKVFTPFWRACLKLPVRPPQPVPEFKIDAAHNGESIADWALLPTRPDWAKGFASRWVPGEAGAQDRLRTFLAEGLAGYGELRNRPDLAHVSRLSPHLHFGEISPRQVWAAAMMRGEQTPSLRKDADKFLAELGWREFSYHLLFHFPAMPFRNLKPEFDAYPWAGGARQLKAWQRGLTGYPLVDAGMRELWTTGYMHNRVRMVAASFLIKHLRIDWREGERWFWDTLVDADLANNSASWQWVAGSGADAAPYFRIFNPVEQGRKFDPNGTYVRQWCPELAGLPDEFVHAPFEAPRDVLEAANITLGETYPEPIVHHGEARAAALAGYDAVKARKAI